jgi:hypothetical protein
MRANWHNRFVNEQIFPLKQPVAPPGKDFRNLRNESNGEIAMRLPTQRKTSPTTAADWRRKQTASNGVTPSSVEPQGIQPSSCCDGTVTIYSPQGQQLYSGSSGCCYDAGQAYCYPCSGEEAKWEAYAKAHFTQCQGTPTCSISLTGCGSLTPYC